MGSFNFTATAQCNYCGNLLESSDKTCGECDSDDIYQQMFRRISDGEPEIIAVESTHTYKWYKLKSEIGENWIEYEWVGPREDVLGLINSGVWNNITDVPMRQMPHDGPSEISIE